MAIKDKQPKVTVLCTVFNGERYFDRAIPSILNQTYKNFDFLIINDGSTDNTLKLLLELEKSDNRINVINAGRLGRVKALNLGIKESNSELIAIQDFDDISYPERLEQQVVFMINNPEISWLGTAGKGIYESTNEIRINKFPLIHEQILKNMAHSIPYDHTTVMFRKEAVSKVGCYKDIYGAGVEDFLLSVELAINGYKFANLEAVLGEHIEHSLSYWNSNYKYMERQLKIQKIQIFAINKLNLPIWMYIFPLGRYFYGYLPSRIKKYIRFLIGKKEY